MAKRLGFIAEDLSDIEVLTILAKKLTVKQFTVSHFVGKGCGPILRKTPGWCANLLQKGCSHVVVVHDLDRHNMQELKAKLDAVLVCAPQRLKAVVIPVEELEAWLLSDVSAIAVALNLPKIPENIHHPETISSPKEHIGKLVRKIANTRKEYVNTVHNHLIAQKIDIKKLKKKCPSFKSFSDFIANAV